MKTKLRHQPQIKPEEYRAMDYLDKPRWISYWYQISEVTQTNPKTVLEIGLGNGLVAHTLRKLGITVKTIDIDKRLKPDYVGSVLKMPFKAGQFDTIICAQVLEHLPFSEFPVALQELHRVAKKYVIITLPYDYLTYFLVSIKLLPFISPKTWFTKIPGWRPHQFNGQHYWEVGKQGYSLQKIVGKMQAADFRVGKNYSLPENPYHQFFVLRKNV